MKNRIYTYVALLRGVNAGGNRRVEMVRLRELFQQLGFADVKTYINSGNVIFSANSEPDASSIQKEIEREFGFDVPTLILSSDDVIRIAESIPPEWTNDYTDRKTDVLYLFNEVNSPEIIAAIGVKPEIETFLYVDGAVACTISRKDAARGSLQKIVGTPLYKQVTVRNATTARKLAELVR